MVILWDKKIQILFLIGILCKFQHSKCEMQRRMDVRVLKDELGLAESIIKQKLASDWSSRISSKSTPTTLSTASSNRDTRQAILPNTKVISKKEISTTLSPSKPSTHISAILKAIRVLGNEKNSKEISTPKPVKKKYYKGAYKSLSTVRKLPTSSDSLPLEESQPLIIKSSSLSSPQPRIYITKPNPQHSAISTSLSAQDPFIKQPPKLNKTIKSHESSTKQPSTTPSSVFLRRASVKAYPPSHSTTVATKPPKTLSIPKSYLIPVHGNLNSPGDVITKSITDSIQKIPKSPDAAFSQENYRTKPASKTSKKRTPSKKVVIIKKVIKSTPKARITTPPPEFNFRDDSSSEYRKDYSSPDYDQYDYSDGQRRYTSPVKRMRERILNSNEEPEEPKPLTPPFEIPKFDLSSSNLNEKGCKTRVKEVQEHRLNDKNSSSSNIHPTYYRPLSHRKKRTVKSIIVTKECFFPGEEEEVKPKEAPYQTQADNQREIYHPYAQRHHEEPHVQPSENRENGHQEEPKEYSKSYSDSYYSTSKPVQKEYAYYSTSRPVVKEYSHSESGPREERNNYRPYAGNFDDNIYVLRPDQTQQNRQLAHSEPGPRHQYIPHYHQPHTTETRGQNYYGPVPIPDYSKLASDGYNRELHYARNSAPVYNRGVDYGKSAPQPQQPQPTNVRQNKRQNQNQQTRAPQRESGEGNSEKKPKKTKKTFAFYRKDNDPKNNGFSEQYAQGSYTSFSNDYDSDRDAPQS